MSWGSGQAGVVLLHLHQWVKAWDQNPSWRDIYFWYLLFVLHTLNILPTWSNPKSLIILHFCCPNLQIVFYFSQPLAGHFHFNVPKKPQSFKKSQINSFFSLKLSSLSSFPNLFYISIDGSYCGGSDCSHQNPELSLIDYTHTHDNGSSASTCPPQSQQTSLSNSPFWLTQLTD